MKKICLVFLVDKSFDCLAVFEQAFSEHGFEIETKKFPYLWQFTSDYVKSLKRLISSEAQSKFLIFSPQSSELFLPRPNVTVSYSAYRTWFNPNRMTVIPHLWSPVKAPQFFDHIMWKSKPPLRVGFMGRSFANSRLANLGARLPLQLRKWLLRGTYVRHASIIALMNDFGFSPKALGAFPRIETLHILKEQQHKFPFVELDVIEKESFSGSSQEMNDYVAHLERNTYVICPRGTENYSYRMYEALSRGRIPVIIDTDVVLPKEVDWNDLSIVVPYELLNRLYELICLDYSSHSPSEFVARQQRAFSTMERLRNMGWVNRLIERWGAIAKDGASD